MVKAQQANTAEAVTRPVILQIDLIAIVQVHTRAAPQASLPLIPPVTHIVGIADQDQKHQVQIRLTPSLMLIRMICITIIPTISGIMRTRRIIGKNIKMIERGNCMKALTRIIVRIGHLMKSRKTCKGNCLTCPYFEDCCGDYPQKER